MFWNVVFHDFERVRERTEKNSETLSGLTRDVSILAKELKEVENRVINKIDNLETKVSEPVEAYRNATFMARFLSFIQPFIYASAGGGVGYLIKTMVEHSK